MLIHSPKELAFYMSDRRKSLALSQHQASDVVGLRQATLSAFENHPDGGKVATLFRILSALELELHLQPKEKRGEDVEQWEEEW